MAFELPPLPYDYEALQPFMSKETLEYHHDKHHKAYVDNGNKLAAEAGLGGLSLTKIVKQSFGKNAPALQQRRPALQPHPFLEVDEEGRRRQQAARRAAEGLRQRPRRLRQVQGRFRRGRHHAVRLGLGLGVRQGRQARHLQDPERREPAGPRRACRSSASTCGSIPTTSTIATPGRNISRPSSTA